MVEVEVEAVVASVLHSLAGVVSQLSGFSCNSFFNLFKFFEQSSSFVEAKISRILCLKSLDEVSSVLLRDVGGVGGLLRNA